jgi:hypothetical protein
MRSTVRESLDALRALGTSAEIRELASSGFAPATPPKVNAHIHLPPNFSAFESARQAVDLAAAEGIGVLGVSNYYDYEIYGDFVHMARDAGIFPLFGLEIICLDNELVSAGIKVNDPGNPGKIYICGKGITRFDAMSDEATRLLGLIRRNDADRMSAMVDSMEKVVAERGLETSIDAERVRDLIVRRHGSARETVYLQERHAAQAFQEAIFDAIDKDERLAQLKSLLGAETSAKSPDDHVAVQNDLRSHLMKAGKPAFVEETFVTFDEARRLVLELGGIPAYPTLADGTQPVCPFEHPIDSLIDNILSREVHASEFIPTRNAPEVLGDYVRAMRAAGLAITAGTEHNTLDLIALEPTCVGGAAIPDDVQSIFWEGACVVAAHQFLTLHGECGYVDQDGKPNGDYSSADERIRDFATLGAAVVQRFSAASSGKNEG